MNIKAITTTLVLAALTGSVIELATCNSALAQDRGARFTFAPNQVAPMLNQRRRYPTSAFVPAVPQHQVSHGSVPKGGNFFGLNDIPKPVHQPQTQIAVRPQLLPFNNAFGQPIAPAIVAPKALHATPKQLPAISPAAKNVSARVAPRQTSKRYVARAPRKTGNRSVAKAPASSYGSNFYKPGSFVNYTSKTTATASVNATIIKKH